MVKQRKNLEIYFLIGADACDKLYESDKPKWINVDERLPENEELVFICSERKIYDGSIIKVRALAMYEDGTMPTGNSLCNWDDNDFEYSEELDEYIIPQGWWEQPIYGEFLRC